MQDKYGETGAFWSGEGEKKMPGVLVSMIHMRIERRE